MFDLPPDVPRLRALETQLRIWLRHVEQALAVAEREEAAERRRQQQKEARRRPAGDWILDHQHRPPLLHQGWCWEPAAGMRPITRAQALEALTVGGVQSCPGCHPDVELGVLA